MTLQEAQAIRDAVNTEMKTAEDLKWLLVWAKMVVENHNLLLARCAESKDPARSRALVNARYEKAATLIAANFFESL